VDSVLLGLSLGLGAGLSPGPLLALVVRASLQRGFGAGVQVAVAPLIVDAPIVVASLLVLHTLPEQALGGLAVAGGLLVAYLGVEALRGGHEDEPETAAMGDLRRGALVNLASPHPWLFWIAVGGPIVVGADGAAPAAGFIAAFYLVLVGSKVALAAVVAGGRRLLGTTGYAWALRGAGLLLVAAGAALLAEGIGRIG
jgi:threonine/homoserine/homoserine lactone efflux protein